METPDQIERGGRAGGDHEITEALAEESPEGCPAGPDQRPSGWLWIVLSMFLLTVLIGLLIAVLVDTVVGIVILAIGGALVVFNPVLWAGFARAKDRKKVEQD